MKKKKYNSTIEYNTDKFKKLVDREVKKARKIVIKELVDAMQEARKAFSCKKHKEMHP